MIIPALIIFTSFFIGFSNILSNDIGKTIILVSLLIITPIVFFYNGFRAHKIKKNILVFSIPSWAAFSLVFFICLNSSDLAYYIYYLIANIAGYYYYILDKKLDKRKDKNEVVDGFYSKKK